MIVCTSVPIPTVPRSSEVGGSARECIGDLYTKQFDYSISHSGRAICGVVGVVLRARQRARVSHVVCTCSLITSIYQSTSSQSLPSRLSTTSLQQLNK